VDNVEMMIVFKPDMVYQANMIHKKIPMLLVTFFLVFLQMLTVVDAMAGDVDQGNRSTWIAS